MSDLLWDLTNRCWGVNPKSRPTTDDVVQHLMLHSKPDQQPASHDPAWNSIPQILNAPSKISFHPESDKLKTGTWDLISFFNGQVLKFYLLKFEMSCRLNAKFLPTLPVLKQLHYLRVHQERPPVNYNRLTRTFSTNQCKNHQRIYPSLHHWRCCRILGKLAKTTFLSRAFHLRLISF
jgi:hypothetical protein